MWLRPPPQTVYFVKMAKVDMSTYCLIVGKKVRSVTGRQIDILRCRMAKNLLSNVIPF